MARTSLSVAIAFSLASSLTALACSSAPSPDAATNEPVAQIADALSTSDAIARAEQWVAAQLHYCQAPYGQRDYDSACSTYCNRQSNPAWNPYRSDCSGLVSWAWGLAAPGRVTGEFAPFQTDITKAIAASDLRAGDAVNNSEHVMLFKAWVTPGKRATFIEEPGCSVSQPYAREWESDVTINGESISVAYNGMTFTAIRYGALTLPPPPNTPPKGALDGAKCDAITGWAQDPDQPTAPLHVKLDFDAAEGKSGAAGSITLTANVNRPDLCGTLGSCNHGFRAPLPLGLRDGNAHTVYAYGADDTAGTLQLLSAAPKSITCASPAIPLAAPDGIKRWVASQKVLGAWGLDELLDVAREPAATVAAYTKGPDMPAAPTAVIADDGSPEVWVIDGNERRHVVSAASLTSWGFSVAKWPAAKVSAVAQGRDWPAVRFAFMAEGAPEVYVLDSAVPAGAGAGDGGGTDNTGGCAVARGEGADMGFGGAMAAIAIALVAVRRKRAG